MTEHPNTSRGDIAYWELTHDQAAHHYARLARMYADRATGHADKAARHARKSELGLRVAGVLLGVFIVLKLVGMVADA